MAARPHPRAGGKAGGAGASVKTALQPSGLRWPVISSEKPSLIALRERTRELRFICGLVFVFLKAPL